MKVGILAGRFRNSLCSTILSKRYPREGTQTWKHMKTASKSSDVLCNCANCATCAIFEIQSLLARTYFCSCLPLSSDGHNAELSSWARSRACSAWAPGSVLDPNLPKELLLEICQIGITINCHRYFIEFMNHLCHRLLSCKDSPISSFFPHLTARELYIHLT